jgi:hypothetical protein
MTSLRIRSFGLIAFAAAALAGPLTGVAQAVAPTTHTPALAITGTALQGDTLQSNGGDATLWDGTAPLVITDQWYDCTTASTAGCAAISGATGASYLLGSSDVNQYVYLAETASNTDGPTTANSGFIGPVNPLPPAPVGASQPTVSGTAQQGQPLTDGHANWSNSPSGYTYQWQDCDSTGANCVNITGATNQTYTLVAADVGKTIVVQETASNAAGAGAADPSVATAVVTGVPVSSTGPSITGTTWQGQTLTEGHATWSNTPLSYTYQWQDCDANGANCANITGATNQSYTLVAADVGRTIVVLEIATNTVGAAATAAVSAATAVVTLPPPGANAPPSISGTAQQGMTLTEGAAHWSNSPTSITITWYRCDSNGSTCKANGTGATYLLTADDLGALIQVSETASNASNVPVTAVSPYAGPVASPAGHVDPPTLKASSQPGISGVAQLGRTLTASRAQFNGNPGNFSDQWLRCNALGCVAIPGATVATYTPTSADVGDSIAFAETASNSGGTSSSVQSARTGAITAPSTTTVQSNSSSPVAGQTVTLIATVTSAAGSVKPAGTVDFHVGAAAIPGCSGLALGSAAPTAVCQAWFPASVANVTAAYSATPGTFITGSTSSATTLIVGRAATTVTVATSARATLGAKTTYTATVHPPAGSTLTPTGRVTFTDGGKSIKGCGSQALAAHGAPCSVTYLGIKQHRIAAQYGGDANFASSASITSHVLVQPKAPSGVVSVFMNWTFGFTPHTTRIKSLTASGLSKGIRITVTCAGGGCPFARRTLAVPASGKCGKGKTVTSGCLPARSINLAPIFHGAHMHLGTKLTVTITHRNWLGKYYRFTVRPSHLPKILVSCLAVNGTRPGVGCSAR